MTSPFLIRRVSGVSMKPTLSSGDILIAKSESKINVGNVVIAKVNGREIVKRISKLRDSEAYILGDNADASTDSRSLGWIKSDQIIGKVIWPKTSS